MKSPDSKVKFLSTVFGLIKFIVTYKWARFSRQIQISVSAAGCSVTWSWQLGPTFPLIMEQKDKLFTFCSSSTFFSSPTIVWRSTMEPLYSDCYLPVEYSYSAINWFGSIEWGSNSNRKESSFFFFYYALFHSTHLVEMWYQAKEKFNDLWVD